MFFIVRLFFLIILTSVVLSAALGWFAIARAKMHLGKAFGMRNVHEKNEQSQANIIEGEYKVLTDEDKM